MIDLGKRETTISGGDWTRGRQLSDPAVFDAFYAEALPVVYGYFLRRTGGVPAVAEDLTQETFLSAVRQIGKGARVDAPMPWLIGMSYKAIRTRRHKYIHWTQKSLDGVACDELYDLRSDPYEMHNRIHEPGAQQALRDLQAQLQRLLRETGVRGQESGIRRQESERKADP